VRDVLVLGYHAVSDDWPASLSVPPDRLERQLEHLLERGYRGTTFTEAVTRPPARRTLAVTFDDGFRSVYELAAPVLTRLGLPGTVFVPTSFLGEPRLVWPGIDRWLGGAHDRELAPLSWHDARSLADLGWEVGSHTRTHPDLRTLDDTSLADELEGSRRDCEEQLGGPCTAVAYPYCAHDDRVVRAARKAGYLCAADLPTRLHPRRRYDWPRVGVFRTDYPARYEAKVGRLRRYLIGSRPGEKTLRAEQRLRGTGR
jgi:peptidoglycan/xylan/chitin deacetylase (PgdA/CDA1 family)